MFHQLLLELRKNFLIKFLPNEKLKIRNCQKSHMIMASLISNGPSSPSNFGKSRQ